MCWEYVLPKIPQTLKVASLDYTYLHLNNLFMGSEPQKYLVIHQIFFLQKFVHFIFLLD